MNSYKAYIKKEILEGVRTHKFLVLAAAVLFFAISDPIFIKILPEILKNQFGTMDVGNLVDVSQRGAMMNYMKSLYQISTFIIALSLMGIIAQERSNKTLTLPVSMGCNRYSIVLSKITVYGIYLILLSILGMLGAYYYSSILLDIGFASYKLVFKAAILHGLFYCFLLSMLSFFSSLFSKSFISGIFSILLVYLMPVIDKFFRIGKYLPTHLLTEAKYFSSLPSTELRISIVWTIGYIVIFTILTGIRLEKIEWV